MLMDLFRLESRWREGAVARLARGAFGLAAIAGLMVGLRGCREKPADHRVPDDTRGVSRGDRVVVEQSAAEFFEGQVVRVEGSRLRVQTTDEGESVDVAVADAYRLPPTAHEFAVGDLAICGMTPMRWRACRVERVSADALAIRDAEGREVRLPRNRVLGPTKLTELNLRRHFDRVDKRRAFAQAVERAGMPRAPRGWRPAPHERVLGYQGSAWYSASIHEIEDDALHVRWQSDGRVTELTRPHVVPEPPYQPPPTRGDFGLLRPTRPAQPWQPVRVVASNPEGLVVVGVDGQRRSAELRDVVPLR